MDNLPREICSLQGACIQGYTKRLPSLVKPTDYHLFLLFHIGSGDKATWSNQKRLYDESIRAVLKQPGAQAILHSPSQRRGFVI